MKGLIAKKVGMTQIFDESGNLTRKQRKIAVMMQLFLVLMI